ncbi:transposase [Streptomyces bingchenggensis BCW-1]|uniref:Transposase n=1 Tax=Streptomyces bingchenggensis (strain BCW-1) TaxID=749414 RepID=D7C9E4_STRBB|nr:transposase [Streptomyces bingchenggensis BCW-1]
MAFLTDEQRRSYGTFTAAPDDGQLAGYFLLDRDARWQAMACRGAPACRREQGAQTVARRLRHRTASRSPGSLAVE